MERGSFGVQSPTTNSVVTSRMSLENFLNLWALVSSSVRYEGRTTPGLVLWLKCSHGAWPIGLWWRSAVLTVRKESRGMQNCPTLSRGSVELCHSGSSLFFFANNLVELEVSSLCGPQFLFRPARG